MNITIKTKLIGLTSLCIALVVVVGLTGYIGVRNLNAAIGDIVNSSQILRNHMTADMMHDALHADVQAALLAAETGNKSELATAQSDYHEHASLFTHSLAANQKLIGDAASKQALNQVAPALNAYIAAAGHIIALAGTDRKAAMNDLSQFKSAFDKLADEMEALTDIIEKNTLARQQDGDAAVAAATQISIAVNLVGIAAMVLVAWLITRNIVRALTTLMQVSDKVANGDLTMPISVSQHDEVGHLAESMEKMRVRLIALIAQIVNAASQLSTATDEISTVTSATSTSVKNQQAETEQVAAAMNEMTATVHDVATNISLTASAASNASIETHAGNLVVQQAAQEIRRLETQISDASEIINRLDTSSRNISSVLDVISNIAEQTNLLALNAAIEAARAGELGRGFAVVADEVRTLASRTQQSTEEINSMIDQLQNGAKEAVDAIEKSRRQTNLVVAQAEKAGASLATISTAVTQISDMSTQIASAAEQQGAVSEEINRNISRISDMTHQAAAGTQQTAMATHELVKMTADLQNAVGQFKV
jgi:methyl-accepting chemotaxis protein